jgi:hypothetical protein
MGANTITCVTLAPLGLFFGLFYSWNIPQKVLEKIFKKHDIFYSTLIRLALKFCQKYVIKKEFKLLNMSFYYLKALVIVLY